MYNTHNNIIVSHTNGNINRNSSSKNKQNDSYHSHMYKKDSK